MVCSVMITIGLMMMQQQPSRSAVGGIVLLGAPGSGKGTQAEQLQRRYNIPAISSGDILRDHVKRGTELGRKADPLMRAGRLVPDEVLNPMMEERLGQPDCAHGFILDGYPRTVPQAEALDALLERRGIRPPRVFLLEVAEDGLLKRLTGRRSCPLCGRSYNIYYRPPAKEGVCDADGAALIQRPDDREDVIRQRLAAFHQQTQPVIEYYRKRGRFYTVDGDLAPEKVAEAIFAILEEPAAPLRTQF